jgi:large subunit ribosomal protein L29
MTATELRDMDEGTLVEHVATVRRDVFGLRMQHATGELDNTASLRTAKRELARALTVVRQRGIDPTAPLTETTDG